MFYAGIGSRQTPLEIRKKMTEYAGRLEKIGYILRSGGANGADLAFENGVLSKKEIYLPFHGFNNNKSMLFHIKKECYEIASKLHPVWNNLGDFVKKAMARNVYQVLGYELDKPSEFVLCYTPDGAKTKEECTKDTGGTGMAIKIASQYNIKIFNFKNKNDLEEFEIFLNNLEKKLKKDFK